MKIEDAIIAVFMQVNDDCRLTLAGRWMFWDGQQWIVLERKYGQRRNREIIETGDLALALRALADQE